MPTLAFFGINSSGLNLAIDLLILFLVVLYVSLIYWTYNDAKRRIMDPMLIGCATAASLFPYVGTVVYIILRPPEYLEDVRERELEVQAAEVRLASLERSLCPHCDYQIEPDFLRCPSCMRKLKDPCSSCGRPLERTWQLCPYCEAEVSDATQSRRAGRKREREPGRETKSASASASTARTRAGTGADSRAKADADSRASAGFDTHAGAGAGSRASADGDSEAQTGESELLPTAKPSPATGSTTPRSRRPRSST